MSVCVNVCVYVFLCVSAHLRVFVYVVCVHTHMCMFKSVRVHARGGQRTTSVRLASDVCLVSLRYLFLLPQHWDYKHIYHACLFSFKFQHLFIKNMSLGSS